MNGDVTTVVIGFKTLTLALGGLITYFAAKAARRTHDSGLTALAGEFAVVTFGSLLAGVADQLLSVDAATALVVESALTAVGFCCIAHSLYVTSR
ncbi:MAG: hypothetical protein ABEJ61_09460 [Haloferacaceae archaeon]